MLRGFSRFIEVHKQKENYRNLFSSFILAAPETELKTHHLWLEKVSFISKKRWVLYSKKDLILWQAHIHAGESRLGRGPMEPCDPDFSPVKGLHYVDMEEANQGHRYIFNTQDLRLRNFFISLQNHEKFLKFVTPISQHSEYSKCSRHGVWHYEAQA